MPFKYDKLWDILKERDISKDKLRFDIRSSQTTIVKMGKNDNVSLEVIDKICKELNITPDDFLEFVPWDENTVYVPVERNKGDIFSYELPMRYRNESEEDSGVNRYVLIFQNDDFINASHHTVVIPFSYEKSMIHTALQIEIKPDDINGLDTPCVLRVDDIRMIQRSRLKDKIGSLSKKDMQAVNKACSDFLGL